LTAAEAAGQLSGESAGELREVFELLLRLRLQGQVAQVERGQPTTNMLYPAELSPLTRAQLVQAFQVIAAHQKQLGRYVPIGL
jgi:CBS domain-containing protein